MSEGRVIHKGRSENYLSIFQTLHRISSNLQSSVAVKKQIENDLEKDESFNTTQQIVIRPELKIPSNADLTANQILETLKDTKDVGDKKSAAKKPEEMPWRITPSQDLSKLLNHYLMLSKIRLTCNEFFYLLLFRLSWYFTIFNSSSGRDYFDGRLCDGSSTF